MKAQQSSHFLSLSGVLAVLLCLVHALIPCSAWAKIKRQHKEGRRAETREIEGLERQWRDALLKTDTSTLDKMMADDFLAVSSNGTLSDKQQYLTRLSTHANQFTALDLVDLKVRVHPGSAVAISQTRLSGTIEGHPVTGLFRNTRVYGRSAAGQWRVLNSEATRVSGSTSGDEDMEGGVPLHTPVQVHP